MPRNELGDSSSCFEKISKADAQHEAATDSCVPRAAVGITLRIGAPKPGAAR